MIKKALLLLVIFTALVSSAFYFVLNYQVHLPLNLNTEKLVAVKPGTTVHSFSQRLVDYGWLSNRFWLRTYVRLHPNLSQLKSGTYNIEPGMTAVALLQKIVAGHEHQFSITFVEGSTLQQWLALLSEQTLIAQTLTTTSIAEIAQLLGIAAENPEGWFYPDTYAYTANTPDITILRRAHDKMRQELNQLWHQRALGLPYTSPYEALIMASIVEKESGQVQEQPLIASVFVNRLTKGMRLQTDPTVIYGLGERYQGDIKKSHLREKTPYNTYRIDGLPPTPIAMPGKSALQASLAPAPSDYLYFVSQGNGYHIFSRNLTEHNQAVSRYQLNRK